MGDFFGFGGAFAALLVGFLTLWYGEIKEACDAPVDRFSANRDDIFATCRWTYWVKTIPLAAAAIVVFLILLPTTLGIIGEAVQLARVPGVTFDPLKAGFIGMEAGFGLFALYLLGFVIRLARHLKKLSPKSGDLPSTQQRDNSQP
jgi:hypothetical protein